jgi:hypothetical protein
LVVLRVTGEVPAGSLRTGWKRNAAGIDVRNVMMNSIPKIRAVPWSSAMPSPFEPVGCCLSFTLSIPGFDQSRAGFARPAARVLAALPAAPPDEPIWRRIRGLRPRFGCTSPCRCTTSRVVRPGAI